MNDNILNLEIQSGAPATAIPKEFHMAVGKILNNLQASGAAKIVKRSQYEWTIEVNPRIARGQPGLYKAVTLRAVQRGTGDEEGSWVLMSPEAGQAANPTITIQEAEATGATTALAPYYDYVRAVDL